MNVPGTMESLHAETLAPSVPGFSYADYTGCAISSGQERLIDLKY
jgi:hypothetical protein